VTYVALIVIGVFGLCLLATWILAGMFGDDDNQTEETE